MIAVICTRCEKKEFTAPYLGPDIRLPERWSEFRMVTGRPHFVHLCPACSLRVWSFIEAGVAA